MREVKRNGSKAKAETVKVPVEIDGKMVMMTICKPVPAPKGLTARCQG